MTRILFAFALALLPVGACSNTANTAATKPMSPANGAADYKDSPGGPHEPAVVPSGSGEPNSPSDCPPKCSEEGSWIGCGLKKPRGTGCKGCTPKCKGKGTTMEGWYDCNGVMIAERKCE